MSPAAAALLPADLRVLERGWLSSNSVLMTGDPRGAVLVDTGYCSHVDQTETLIAHELAEAGESLRLIVNTHLHSDHCGGNARLRQLHGCPVLIPPGQFDAVQSWDEERLSYRPTGQRCPRFQADGIMQPGTVLAQAGREWEILAAPGHDPDAVMLFERRSGVLISADALWEHGFGIVFPEIDGVSGFDEVEQSLDLIESLPVRLVIPGHGAVFSGVGTALAEARSRLAFFRLHPDRHARHAAKALLMFHMLERGESSRADLLSWLERTPIHAVMWRQYFGAKSLQTWTEELLQELVRAAALQLDGEMIHCT
ncbi:MBL fold metallo-hydrolase [Pelomonas sp. V22]|uniref:MBL fold metallo-hydrolase n=1 Tax=Pelomonas sp. V22 TaxID=2822139 RepID=UPI0024A8952E|nr:MBL fold metallo-hydrolase [Pelomonas sp. V22]MDI4634894.1 MBL fold metallo-hydrolase [Pelomonas sp. V22]